MLFLILSKRRNVVFMSHLSFLPSSKFINSLIQNVLRWCGTASLAHIAIAVMVFSAASPSSFASTKQRLSLVYDVFYGGIKASSLEVDVAYSDHTYRLRSRIIAKGPIGWLTGFVSQAESEGAVEQEQIRLRQHRARSEWFGESRSVLLRPNGDSALNVKADPLPQDDNRDPVEPSSTIGTLDPLTASFKAAREIDRTRDCAQKLQIFDGRRRYDLDFRDGVETSLESESYRGPALRCRMDVVRIAGFSRKPFFQPPETPPEVFVWLAQVRKDTPLIPVQITIDSPFANTKVHLTQVIEGHKLLPLDTIEKIKDRVDARTVEQDVMGPRHGDQ